MTENEHVRIERSFAAPIDLIWSMWTEGQHFTEWYGPWARRFPGSWETSWNEFIAFLEFPAELRKIVYTTNAIESLNARFRRAVRHRGHFPNEQAALKVLYLVATTRRKNRENLTGRTNGWKQILNALTVHYGDRITNNR